MIQILGLTLAMFTFVGSVGLGVFTHFCHEDGVEQSFIIPKENACVDQHEEIETCCSAVEQIAESNCCSDQVDYFQVEFDNFESQESFVFLPIEYLAIQPFVFAAEIASSEVNFSNYANPPPLRSGRQILIQHQVFRI